MSLTRSHSPPIRGLRSDSILLVTACIAIFYATNSYILYQIPLQHGLQYLPSIQQDSLLHLERHDERTGSANEAAVQPTDGDYCIALREACRSLEYCITIHVFAYRRVEATRRLLEALASSNYTSYNKISLPLVIHVDKPEGTQYRGLTDAKEEEDKWFEYSQVKDLVQDFADWSHGPLIRNIQSDHKGLRQSWLEAWPNPRPNDIMVAFEDDTLPSPFYLEWMLKILREYNLWDATKRDNRLLGISLSPIRFDEISIPIRPWMAYKKYAPAKYPLHLHALPSSWGAVYFGNQWRDFLEFVRLRGHPPFYSVKDEETVKFDSPRYAWGTRYGDPNLWLPKGSPTNGWAKSWKRFMVDFAYGRGAYMLYPNLPNATGLATSLFLSGEHIAASAVKNRRQAPLLDGNKETLALFNSPLPSFRSLPLVDMYCEEIDRMVHAQHGDAFVGRIAGLGTGYEALAHTWRRPCMLRGLDQASKRSNGSRTDHSGPMRASHGLVARRRYIFLLPRKPLDMESPETVMATNFKEQKDDADILAQQLIEIAEAAIWSKQLSRTLILPPLTVGRKGKGIKNDWVPFNTLFYPDDSLLRTVLPGIDYIFADVETLRGWDQPNHIALIEEEGAVVPAHNRSLTGLHKDYLEALGWSHVSQVSITLGNHGTEGDIEEDGIYAALGSCTDEVLVLGIGTLDVARGSDQRRLLSSAWKALFHPARVVEHMAHHVKAQMKYHYDCLCMPLTRGNNITSLRAPNLLVISSSQPTEGNQTGSFRGKWVLARHNIAGVVNHQILITHPHATHSMRRAVASLMEMTLCADAHQVIWTNEDPLPQTAMDFVIYFYRKK